MANSRAPAGARGAPAVVHRGLLVGAVVAQILAFDQLLFVEPRLYLVDGLGPPHTLASALGLASLALGAVIAARHRSHEKTRLGWALLALAFTAATSGIGLWLGLGCGWHLGWLALAFAVTGGGLVGVNSTWIVKDWLWPIARRLGGSWLLHPASLGITVAALLLASAGLAQIGILRSSLIVAGLLAFCAACWPWASGLATPARRNRDALRYRAPLILLALLSLGAHKAEEWIPLGQLLASDRPVVYAQNSERVPLAITSGQGAFWVLLEGRLIFSTLDAQRWAETLIRPLLARVREPHHALVLGWGNGLAEHELLADPSKLTVTSVYPDRRIPEASRRIPFWRELSGAAFESERLRGVECDLAFYAKQPISERYDLIVLDFPDPTGPEQAKYYTRYVFGRMAQRLTEDGVMVVQATSPIRTPETFATIGTTLRAAGLIVQPLRVPLIAQGEWGLYLAAHRRIPAVLRPQLLAKTFPGSSFGELSMLPPDSRPPPGFAERASTLHTPTVHLSLLREISNEK